MENSTNISGDWIKGLIQDFITTSPHNTMKNQNEDAAWESAVVGFAAGADPIWQQYKEYVGAFHWTPWEVFSQHCPESPAGPEELTVVSWVLPQRELVRKANRKVKKFPAEEWARIRIYGEAFKDASNRDKFSAMRLMQPCAGTWLKACKKKVIRPLRPCWFPTGRPLNRNGFLMPLPGPNAMRPMLPAWAPSACATV